MLDPGAGAVVAGGVAGLGEDRGGADGGQTGDAGDRPLERTRYLGVFPYQGLFPARQEAIAADYARLMADRVLTGRNLICHLLEGGGGARLVQALAPTFQRWLDVQLGALAAMVGVEPSAELHATVVGSLAEGIRSAIVPVVSDLEIYLEKRLDVAATLEARLASMDKREFERVLRGIFEEDEWILVCLGGVLGGLIGLLQAGIVAATGMAA